MPTREDFLADHQGRRFVDVLNDDRVNFGAVLALLDDQACRRRMEDSELIHRRPALAGVIAEIEALPDVDRFFRTQDAHTTFRFRQAVGVATRMAMEGLGWRRTGVKGSLGRRAKVAAGTTTPGAYHNVSGPSRWFNKAEHYTPATVEAVPDRIESPPVPGDEQDLQSLFAELEAIGTPEERRATHQYLMKALAESRRAEGREF